MKEKKSYQVYRTIMIITLTAFITFLITTIVGYHYITNGNGKLMLLGTDVADENIETLLQTYRELIDKYYLWRIIKFEGIYFHHDELKKWLRKHRNQKLNVYDIYLLYEKYKKGENINRIHQI